MGYGRYSAREFAEYSISVGKVYSESSGRVSNQVFRAARLEKSLDPRNVMRECINDEEHPNTVPIILALDVTGSMGCACQETAEALGLIMKDLLDSYKDTAYNLEFCMMGIGDLDYDEAPIQMGQFESDVRFAKDLDNIYMEHGGGGNDFESYTAAWYMGFYHTKLDAYDKQGRKGIIITMGDEPLNPYLPCRRLKAVSGDNVQDDVMTRQLYEDVINKFDVYHINVEHGLRFDKSVMNSWKKVLAQNVLSSTVRGLPKVITDCIKNSIDKGPEVMKGVEAPEEKTRGMPVIFW